MPADLSKPFLAGPFFVPLGPRGRLRLSGDDRLAFLQNLATNDLRRLDSQKSLYSAILSPQGKWLHDFFVSVDGGSLLLDCEAGDRAASLAKYMKPFRLRAKVEMAVEPEVETFAAFGTAEEADIADPRDATLGVRTTSRPAGLEERAFAVWDERRIRLALPDGSRDIESGKDTALDVNLDRADGVSFEKGCYVGQEITARMQLRGLVKKRLRSVAVKDTGLTPFADILIGGQLAGQMRSMCGGIGLALIKDDFLSLLDQPGSPLALLEKPA